MSTNTALHPAERRHTWLATEEVPRLVSEALQGESLLNPHRVALLEIARSDYFAARRLFCYLLEMAADWVRDGGRYSRSFDLLFDDMCIAGLVPPDSDECFDVILGYIARVAADVPIGHEFWEERYAAQDRVCAVAVAYALLHGNPRPWSPGDGEREWDEYLS